MYKKCIFNRANNTEFDLKIRLAEEKDAKELCAYFQKNRAFLKPWEPTRGKECFSEEGWKKMLLKINELHLFERLFCFLIIDNKTGHIIGIISFHNVSQHPTYSCTVGYSLDMDAQGKGIMRLALKNTCNWMFNVKNMHKIHSDYMPSNKRSAALLKANKFKKVGYIKDHILVNGKWEDHYLTVLTNPNWQEKK